jgi:predicted metalloprotease
MRWRGGEQSGNLEDRRSMGGAGMALGGGGVLVIMLLGWFFGIDPNKINQVVNQVQQQGGAQGPARPLTPEEEEQKVFAATVLKYTEVVWTEQFGSKLGQRYEPPRMVLFTDRVQSGCGVAPSAVGPFYCPADRTVYLDPTFFTELEDKLGGSAADFSQAYVIAHEIGHHVQKLLGYSDKVDAIRQRASKVEYNQASVRLELQADYLAGVWAHYGQKKFNFIEPGDIEAAITSANAIGDDRLQKRSTGFTSPEKYTHGTSAQRMKWFKRGLESGDVRGMAELFDLAYEQL